MFANAVRCSERSGVRVSKRSGRVFGFVFCSALFFNCSVFCFVRPFRGCVLFGCFVRVFPPIVSLFGCFDWRNDDDLIRCFVRLLVITQCFVRSNCSGWLMFVLFDCFVWLLVGTNNDFFVIFQLGNLGRHAGMFCSYVLVTHLAQTFCSGVLFQGLAGMLCSAVAFDLFVRLLCSFALFVLHFRMLCSIHSLLLIGDLFA